MWTRLLLACHPHKFLWSLLQPVTNTMHVITLLSSMPPTQFRWPFPPRVLVSCLRYVPGAFPTIFVQPRSDFHRCIGRCQKGLQVNIQHKDLSLSYNLIIAGGRINGFIPFLRIFCETQIALSRT